MPLPQEREYLLKRLEEIRLEEDNRTLACRPEPTVDRPKGLVIYELWGLLDDALRQAQREMGIEPDEIDREHGPTGLVEMLNDLAHRLHVELDRARQVLAAIQQAKAHMDGGAVER